MCTLLGTGWNPRPTGARHERYPVSFAESYSSPGIDWGAPVARGMVDAFRHVDWHSTGDSDRPSQATQQASACGGKYYPDNSESGAVWISAAGSVAGR